MSRHRYSPLYKALLASGVKIPLHGNVLITVADDDKQEGLKIAKRFSAIGYGIYATKGTAQYLSSNGIYVKTVDKVKEETDNNVILRVLESQTFTTISMNELEG